MSAFKSHPPAGLLGLAGLALCLCAVAAHAADTQRNLAVTKASPAPAGEARVALVIGNSNYKSSPLRNPANDAEDIAKALQGLGFQVTLKQNQSRDAMGQAIREFGNKLKRGGVGLFYYAGHGMQVKGKNFLIPVDADIQSEDEVPYRSIDANELLAKMETARNRVNIVILDACRNNPFARSFRSSTQGLAQMEAPVGTLVAFATAPGSVAADGAGRNGLYTQYLLASMNQPGLKVEDVFKRVRAGVRKSSGDKQIPWENTSLEGDFYFKPGSMASTSADPLAIELAYWQSIESSTNAEDYKAYLKKYPNGQFVDIAKRRALNPPRPTATVASIVPPPATAPRPTPGAAAGKKVWKEPVTGMELVWIPKGCYTMGSPATEPGQRKDERQHETCVEGYWLSKYEVTNTQYRLFKPSHDSSRKPAGMEGLFDPFPGLNGDAQPVVNVSWNEAIAFSVWLSSKTGMVFRLPTEAEWEYAARAGTRTARYWGDDDNGLCRHANIADRSSKVAFAGFAWVYDGCDDGYKVSAPVGRFTPNAYGLHDMLGNVWEWTASPYDEAYSGGEKRAASSNEEGDRVIRGGSWGYKPGDVRSATRGRQAAFNRTSVVGFRLAREP